MARLLSLGSGHLSRHWSHLTRHACCLPHLLPGRQAQAPTARLAFLPLPVPRSTRLCLVLGEGSLSLPINAPRPGCQGRAATESQAAWAWSGESRLGPTADCRST